MLSTLPDNPRDSRFWAVSRGLQGRFPFSQNFRKFRFDRKGKTFRGFVPLENSREKWKIWKSRPVFPAGTFRTEFRVPFRVYTFLVLYTSFCCHQLGSRLSVSLGNWLGAFPGFTIKWNNILPIRKSIFSHWNFRILLPKWKTPQIRIWNLPDSRRKLAISCRLDFDFADCGVLVCMLSYFLLVILRQSSTVQHGLILRNLRYPAISLACWLWNENLAINICVCSCDLQALSYILGRGRL